MNLPHIKNNDETQAPTASNAPDTSENQQKPSTAYTKALKDVAAMGKKDKSEA